MPAGGCLLTIVIDGMAGLDPALDAARLSQIRPAEVRGMEVYTSWAGVPFRYRGGTNDCGAIIIWTQAPW